MAGLCAKYVLLSIISTLFRQEAQTVAPKFFLREKSKIVPLLESRVACLFRTEIKFSCSNLHFFLVAIAVTTCTGTLQERSLSTDMLLSWGQARAW